ncbi:MAG TPA: hypothetical protein HPQ00_08980 [Magnetococcales bacterium]|nr:hypothetical protein [Magnetococcales bacterium]
MPGKADKELNARDYMFISKAREKGSSDQARKELQRKNDQVERDMARESAVASQISTARIK